MCITLAYIYRIQVKDRLYAYFFSLPIFPLQAIIYSCFTCRGTNTTS